MDVLLHFVKANGFKFSMAFRPDSTFFELKTQIQRQTGLPRDRLELFLGTNSYPGGEWQFKVETVIDEDQETLDYWLIRSGTTLNIRLNPSSPKIQIFVKELSGHIKPVEVHPCESIHDIKFLVATQVELLVDLPDMRVNIDLEDLRLVHYGRVLDDELTLRDYNITEFHMVSLVLGPRFRHTLFFEMFPSVDSFKEDYYGDHEVQVQDQDGPTENESGSSSGED